MVCTINASYLWDGTLAGYTIDFGQKTDVVARRDGITVRVECKRITSGKKLRERVNKAASQLAEAPAIDGEKVISLIYVDVSGCIVEKVKVEVATQLQAAGELNKALRAFLMENIAEVEALNTKHLDLSHGICLIATLPIWTHDFTMHVVSGTEVRAAGALSEERFDELRRALEGFDRNLKGVFIVKDQHRVHGPELEPVVPVVQDQIDVSSRACRDT